MAKKNAIKIEYHPEFLYFNEFVRSRGYNPKDHPEIWCSDDDKMSQFDIFNWMLQSIILKKGDKSIENFVTALSPKLKMRKADLNINTQQWLKFAYNVGFEELATLYSRTIFELLGTTFELPSMKISPVRLHHFRQPGLFNQILRGTYMYKQMLRADPACYYAEGNWIFMPLPETERDLPVGLYDELVIHEILHAPLRAMDGLGFLLREFWCFPTEQSRWHFTVFGELFANLGSIEVLKKAKTFGKSDFGKIIERIVMSRAITSCEAAATTAREMMKIPFRKWADIFRPVFNIYHKTAFLLQERKEIESATGKKLRGILRKKYAYRKPVRGMDKKQARKKVQRHASARVGVLAQQIEELDLIKLLRQAYAVEKNKRYQKAFEHLIEILSDKARPQWKSLLASIGEEDSSAK